MEKSSKRSKIHQLRRSSKIISRQQVGQLQEPYGKVGKVGHDQQQWLQQPNLNEGKVGLNQQVQLQQPDLTVGKVRIEQQPQIQQPKLGGIDSPDDDISSSKKSMDHVLRLPEMDDPKTVVNEYKPMIIKGKAFDKAPLIRANAFDKDNGPRQHRYYNGVKHPASRDPILGKTKIAAGKTKIAARKYAVSPFIHRTPEQQLRFEQANRRKQDIFNNDFNYGWRNFEENNNVLNLQRRDVGKYFLVNASLNWKK